MLSFTFTKKKFDALDSHGKFKWTNKWLGSIYKELIKNKISQSSLEAFKKEYRMLLKWMKKKEPVFPESYDHKDWIEFVSDQVSHHRNEYGMVPKEYDFLPRVNEGDLDDDSPWRGEIPYSIALDGLRSAYNVGSIIRVCDCAGFRSVILGKTLGDEHRGVRKTSMGASSWIPQEYTENLSSYLSQKKKTGIPVIGIETVESSENFTDFPWPAEGIVVFGNEEYGLSKDVLKICDFFVHIPMRGRKNSLNVSNAVSVISFHISSILQ